MIIMARKKAEPKFKINTSWSGSYVGDEYVTVEEKRLDKVTFPKSFDGILTIPSEVTQIGKYVCEDKTEITEVILPENLKFIGIGAFKNCSNLSKIVLPSGLKSLGFGCFEGCSSLKELCIPAGVNFLLGTHLYGLPSDIKLVIDDTNPDFFSDGQAILSKDGATFVRLFADVDKYEINSEVKTIAAGAFMGSKSLSNITIPEGVEAIRDDSFANCESLENIVIPDSVSHFGDHFLWDCPSLKTISISSSQEEKIKDYLSEEQTPLLVIR